MKNPRRKDFFISITNLNFHKKAQLQTMQTVLILVFVFFILAIAFIFIVAQQKNVVKDKLNEQLILIELKKSQIANYLPEIQCSSNAVMIEDCFDRIALKQFFDKTNSSNYYLELLGNIKLSVSEYENGNWTTIMIYDNPKETYDSKRLIKMGVVIFDPITNKKIPGVMNLETYN